MKLPANHNFTSNTIIIHLKTIEEGSAYQNEMSLPARD